MPGKLFIQTYGCQMNEYDSACMAEVLAEAHGLELVFRPEDADVLLLNTCSVREKPQDKVFSQLGRWRPCVRGVGRSSNFSIAGKETSTWGWRQPHSSVSIRGKRCSV